MYYIRDKKFKKIGVVDTKDGKIEYITMDNLISLRMSGVDIKEDIVLSNEMNEKEYQKYLLKIRHKLFSMSKRDEGKEFFVTYSMDDLDNYLKSNGYKFIRTLKILDYCVSSNMYVYILELEGINYKKGFCILTIDINFNVFYSIIPDAPSGTWYLGKNPSASGYAHNRYFATKFKKKLTLPKDSIYVSLYYSKDKGVCFIDVLDLSKKYLVADISKLADL